MKRKLLVFAAVMVMLIAALCASAFAAEVVASGKCGENVTWTLDSDGLLTISGEGEMTSSPWHSYQYQGEEGGIYSYPHKIERVIVCEGVSNIIYDAFNMCTSLVNVEFPNSLIEISADSFYGCSALSSVVIPASISKIGESAFGDCTSLNSMSFSILNGELTIYRAAFAGCCSLKEIAIPDGKVSFHGGYEFADCTSLTSITLGNGVSSVDGSLFEGCSALVSVAIPESVSIIEGNAFYDCTSLNNIIFPDTITTIQGRAFHNCIALTDVFYSGSEEQWNKINIDNYENSNDPLLNATIHFNYKPSHPAGDIDGNGKVENSDLVTIARYIVGLTEGDTKTAVEAYADMNGDGKVDNSDIVTVARKIVGLA